MPAAAIGMGVAVGDYNNDGLPDIYVTQVGRNILYRNNGDGTFTDVTEEGRSGVRGLDFERGVVRLRQRWAARSIRLPVCRIRQDTSLRLDPNGRHHYCIPTIFKPRPSWLFHNNGDGTFTDVSRSRAFASIWARLGRGRDRPRQ